MADQLPPLPLSLPLSTIVKVSKKEQHKQRKMERHARRKERQVSKDKLILKQQKQRRKKRIEDASIAAQRLESMGNDYNEWVVERQRSNAATIPHCHEPPRLTVPATGQIETARSTAPETMLFELLSRKSQTIHPTFFGCESKRMQCDPYTESPIWYGYKHTAVTDISPYKRHPAAGLPRDWITNINNMNEYHDQDMDGDVEDIDDEDLFISSKSKNDNENDNDNDSDKDSDKDSENDKDSDNTNDNNNDNNNVQHQRNDPSTTHPIYWNLIKSSFRAHPAFTHHSPTTLERKQCNATEVNPAVYNRTLILKPLPTPLLDQPFRKPTDTSSGSRQIHIDLPKKPVECPVCKGQPGRLGRSGCPACWRNPKTLPWTFPARTMPGVEQGYSVSNLKFQSLIRIRKRGDERVARAKNTRRELPSVSGKSMAGGDLEKDRQNADLCTHTPFYSRPALALHRIKNESDMLRIIIRNLPDDGVLVDLVVCPHVTTLAHLNLLYVANTNDPMAGLCLEGRVSPLVLLVPTEHGAYHIDLRDMPMTDLHGFCNFSPGASTVLSELRFGNKVVRAGKVPDTLLLLRVPVLSNIAVRQLMTCFLSINTSMKIDFNSRSVRLIRNKMYEIPNILPGNDCIQQYMTPLMLRKRDLKMQIAAQVRAADKAVEEQNFRIARAEQSRRWKKARREKNRQLLLKRQAIELKEKRRLEVEKAEFKKRKLEKIAQKKRAEAKKAMQLLRAGR